MNITTPQLPSELKVVNDLSQEIHKDETLSEVCVNRADIRGAHVNSVSLSEVKMTGVIFAQAILERTSFVDGIFSKCDFTACKLPEASWQRVTMKNGRASGIQLQNSTLKNVLFEDCKMNLANFRFTKLKDALFKNCDLSEADFYNAQLENVSFENCLLNKTEFSASKLKKVDLRTSNITNIMGVENLGGAIIDNLQLMSLAPLLAAQHKIIVRDD